MIERQVKEATYHRNVATGKWIVVSENRDKTGILVTALVRTGRKTRGVHNSAGSLISVDIMNNPAGRTRAITNDDLYAAIRGNKMFSATDDELREFIRDFSGKEAFAAQVTAEAARQVLVGRGKRVTKKNPAGRYGLHVIKNPAGTYSYVGSIPVELGQKVKATKSDVMGGRAFKEGDEILTYKFPVFKTEGEAINFAESHGFKIRKSNPAGRGKQTPIDPMTGRPLTAGQKRRITKRRKAAERAAEKRAPNPAAYYQIFKAMGNDIRFLAMTGEGKIRWTLTRGDTVRWQSKPEATKIATRLARGRRLYGYSVGVAASNTALPSILAAISGKV